MWSFPKLILSSIGDSDEEFIYFNKQDLPREEEYSSKNSNKQSKSKKTKYHGPSPEELYEDDSNSVLVKNETETEDLNLKNEYNESPASGEQKLELTKMMVNNQIGETMRVAGQRGMEYMRQFNPAYGEQFLNYQNQMGRMGNLMNQMYPYNDVATNQFQNMMGSGSGNNSVAVKNQKMINFLMTKDRPIFSQDMYNDQFLNPSKIFPPKESVTDLNNPPVHNRELGSSTIFRNQSPNFMNQNSLFYDRPVLNSSCINSDKLQNPNQQRILQTMLCKQQQQEMPPQAFYDRNYIQGEENIKMEDANLYGGESAMRYKNQTTLENIKKKIKTD